MSIDENPADYPQRTGRRVTIAVIVIAIGLLVGFLFVHHNRASDAETLAHDTAETARDAVPVDIVHVIAAPPTRAFKLPGETAAWYQSTVYARTSGYIADWKKDIGDTVKKGALLADIETPELDADVASARAKLNASGANVKIASADTAFAKSTYDRYWDSPKGVVSDQERQEKKDQLDSSIAKLDATKAQVAVDQAALDRYSAMQAFKQVTAPFDGVITQRHIDIGDLVTAGSTSSTTSLYTVSQSDKIRVFVDVPQRAATGIVIGSTASVTADEFPGRSFDGNVARTANAINLNSRTLKVEVDLPNPKFTLEPGMYVEVTFQLRQPAEMQQVPASALIFRASGQQVAVVGPDDRVRFRNVTIGQDQGDVVNIESGLQIGESVALNASNQLNDHDLVSPTLLESNEPASTQPTVAQPTVAQPTVARPATTIAQAADAK